MMKGHHFSWLDLVGRLKGSAARQGQEQTFDPDPGGQET
jgi:hypothetical protein